MLVDLDKYKVNKKFIQEWFRNNGDRNNTSIAISALACSTMCPCIVVAYWIGEISDWPPDLIEHIKTLIKFYRYTEIINKPEGSPI